MQHNGSPVPPARDCGQRPRALCPKCVKHVERPEAVLVRQNRQCPASPARSCTDVMDRGTKELVPRGRGRWRQREHENRVPSCEPVDQSQQRRDDTVCAAPVNPAGHEERYSHHTLTRAAVIACTA